MKAPSLDLDWEVGVFRAVRALWRQVRPAPAPRWDPARVAHLADHARALTVLAQLLAGAPVRILPAREAGGVRGRDLLLPEGMALAASPEDNRQLYVLRAAVSAAMFRLGARPGHGPTAALQDLRAAAEAVAWLTQALPGFGDAHAAAAALNLAARPDAASLRGRARLIEDARRSALSGGTPWSDPALRAALAEAPEAGPASPPILLWGAPIPWEGDGIEDAAPGEAPVTNPPPTTEVAARPVEEVKVVTLDPREQADAVLQHTFEKVETADSWRGGARDADGADELSDHLEALEEVDLSEVIRGGDPAQSLLRADIAMGTDAPDVADVLPGERGIPYDEWDHRKGAYRPGWCTVYPTAMPLGDAAWAAARLPRFRRLVDALRRRLLAHRTERAPLGRQLDGEEIDLAALVDERAALLAGHGGDPRLYTRRERRRRSFATTVLLDVSLSTDAWVDDRRVLDVARDAVLVLGEVTASLGDDLQVLAFASHTRNRCRAWEVKGFHEPWGRARGRLSLLRPQGYTRIGPALRHGIAELARSGADRRLLLLVSDGKPTDYDRYEGRYGVADVRQTIREAQAAGVAAHALAVDVTARDHLPAMFGPGAWHILPRPDALAEALSTIYGRLTAA